MKYALKAEWFGFGFEITDFFSKLIYNGLMDFTS